MRVKGEFFEFRFYKLILGIGLIMFEMLTMLKTSPTGAGGRVFEMQLQIFAFTRRDAKPK